MKTNILRRVLAMALALIMGLSVAIPFDMTAFAAEVSGEESPTYTVEIRESRNGTVRFKDSDETSREYFPGDTVTIKAKPDDAYELDELTVISEEEVTLEEKSDQTFTFEMPESDVTVEAAFTDAVEAVSEEEEMTEADSEEETAAETEDDETEAASEEETVAETGTAETETSETETAETETAETEAAETEDAETETAETETVETETAETETAETETGETESAEEENEESSSLTEAAQAAQDMIDALPTVEELDEMDSDELNEAYDAILAADEAWSTISEEEQEAVDDSKLDELYEYFNTLTMTTASTGTSKYVSVSKTAKYSYSSYSVGSGWSTNKYEVEYSVNGTDVTAYAYCVEPSESAPGSGRYTVTKLSSSNILAKVIYYGTESLSGTNCFWEQEGYSSYSAGYQWIVVHIASALAYGRSDWDYKITSSTAKSLAQKLVDFAEDADALPSSSTIEDPYFFYTGDDGTEYTNENGTRLAVSAKAGSSYQYTPDITFHADENVYVKFTLQEGVSYVVVDNPSGNGSSSVSDSDGTDTVTIYGGTTFCFQAPLNQADEVSSTYSKSLSVRNLKDYSAYKLQYGSSGYQSLVTVFGDSLEATTAFRVNWVSTPNLYVLKSISSASDDYASMVKNNPNYTLEGARYGVYATKGDAENDENRLRTLITDENGQSQAVTAVSSSYSGDETYFTAGQKFAVGDTLYIKEVAAPSGYQLDTETYKVTLTSGANELETEDTPLYSIVSVQKTDLAYQNGTISEEAIGDLSNILFRLRYYKASSIGGTYSGSRYWGIMTDDDGYATLSADYLTSLGYPVYTDEDGNYIIPLGVLSIRECDSSYSYLSLIYDEDDDGELNSDYTTTNMAWTIGSKTTSGTDSISLLLREEENADGTKSVVVEDEDGNTLSNGSSLQITAADYQAYGDLMIEKISAYNKQKLSGAAFHLEDSDGNTVVPTDDNGITGDIDSSGTITVQSDGTATVEHIPAGSYSLVEDDAPVGYVKPESNSPVVRISGGASTETIENSPVLAGIRIRKYDTDSGEADPEGGAQFEGAAFDVIALQDIYNDKYGTSYSAGDVVLTLTLDEDGYAESAADALVVGSYQIVETGIPTGYLAGDSLTFTISQNEDDSLEAAVSGSTTSLDAEDTDDGTLFDLTGGEISDPVIRGGFSITKVDEEVDDAGLTGTQGDAANLSATYTVTNDNAQSVFVNGTEYASGTVCFTFTTASDGTYTSAADLLPYGTYTITETVPPTGYSLASTVSFTISIKEDGKIVTTDVNGKDLGEYTRDLIWRGSISVPKIDRERDDNVPQGDATLEGAVFTIYNASANSVYVNGSWYAVGDAIMTVTTDANGIASMDDSILPYGTYTVTETTAPTGYLLSDYSATVVVHENGVEVEAPTCEDDMIRVGVEIQKRDAQSEDGTAEGAATLEGTVVNIYNLSDEVVLVDADGDGVRELYYPGQLVYTLTTDENGYASTADDLLPYGTYVAVEVSSPNGYLTMQQTWLDDDEVEALGFVYSADQDIYYDETNGISYFYDKREKAFYCYTAYVTQSAKRLYVDDSDGIDVESFYDDETGMYYDEATDTRYFYDADAGQYYYLSYVRTSAYTYGSYETKFEIRKDGEAVDLTGEEDSIYDLVKRADLSIYKVDDNTQQGMEGVKFRITSMTTGETHTVTTDANGYYNSTSVKHSSANGLWFGLDEEGNSVPVDDSLGALPYDTYYVEEIESDVNAGMDMWSGYIYVTADTVYENGYVINLDINNRTAAISTYAEGEATSNKYMAADSNAVVKDTITYDNLDVGTYLVRSVLMDVDTQSVIVDAEGNEAIGEKTVSVSSTSGTTRTEIELEASNLAGVNAVVFEYFYSVDDEGKETLVYSHTDFEDTEQYVYFAGIGTTATDSETGDHVACADEEITIIDTVEYTNLAGGKKYTVTGTLYLQSNGEVYLDDNGKEVTSSVEFTTDNSGSGSVELTFTFSGVNLAGDSVVAFEEVTRDNFIYAVHADINDKGQTVSFPEIETTATDSETGLHEGSVDETVTIVDTVAYSGLTEGNAYVMTGTLMDQSTGEALADEKGNTFETSVEFTAAEGGEGTIEMEFTIPCSIVAGKATVVFESLTYEGIEIAVHTDITDEGQTVYYPEIGTTATDTETGLHEGMVDDEVTIIDTVEYTGLIPGSSHVMTGTLMNKTTGEVLTNEDGNTYTVSTAFVASDTGSGSVDLIFTVPGELVAGQATVVFEALYYEEVEVAVHADMDDEGQTVYYPEIHTTALDAGTGLHEGLVTDTVTIIDTVEYSGLIAGKTYTMTGTLINKTTGEALVDAEGTVITSSAEFTASETGEGSVEITFAVDGSLVSGQLVVAFESVTYEGIKIAIHADINDAEQTVYYPEIHTTALDAETGLHEGLVEDAVTIVDTVDYTGLVPDREYAMTGTLMDKATGEKLTDSEGNTYTATVKFIASESGSGTMEMTFTVPGSIVSGKSVVVFESASCEDREIAVHADIEDVNQSVSYPEVATSASDKKDGDSEIIADGIVTIVDTVTYTALIPGNTYRVSGVLMDAETEEATEVDGKEITAEKTFVAEKANGTVEVEFTFDASGLTHNMVVFEQLYTVDTETEEEILVAAHEDIEDEAQTITVTSHEDIKDEAQTITVTSHEDIEDEAQTITVTEETDMTTTTTTTTTKKGSSPKTGVTDHLWLLLSLAAASGASLLCSRKRRKGMK